MVWTNYAQFLVRILLTLLNLQFVLSLLLELIKIYEIFYSTSSLVDDVSLRIRLLSDFRHLTDLFVTVDLGIEIRFIFNL